MRVAALAVCFLMIPAAGCGQTLASPGDLSADAPVTIPLQVTRNVTYGTYSASISVGVGDAAPLPFRFDTGSSGLHVYADADLLRSGSGVACTDIPTSVVYGNPPRIVFSGVVCYAQLHFSGSAAGAGAVATPDAVRIAYLTSGSCPPNNPGCRIPDLHSVKQMGGYGIFGAGLTGVSYGHNGIANPLTSLVGRRGHVFSVALRRDGGQLVLGGSSSPSASPSPGTQTFAFGLSRVPGERYSLPTGCLFVNESPSGHCPLLSFDTGNGVPFLHDTQFSGIPVAGGYVAAGTRLGVAAISASRPATTLLAGTAFAQHIPAVVVTGQQPLTNVSIQAFFDHVVTYDDVGGSISVSTH
jgi:hypothetical protein